MSDIITPVEDPPGSGLYYLPDGIFDVGEGLYVLASLDPIEIESAGDDGLFDVVSVEPAAEPVAEPVTLEEWSLDLCDGWSRIGSVAAFTFNGTSQNMAAGAWQVECAAPAVFWSDGVSPEDVDSVRLVHGRRIMYAGLVADPGAFETEITPDGKMYRWSGADLWHLLEGRLAFPDPSANPTYAAPAPWTVTHDERSGTAGQVAAEYLSHNMGPLAVSARRIVGLSVATTGEGETGDWSARLQTVAEVVKRVCEDGGLVCRLSATFDGGFAARIQSPSDFSSAHVLSDQGDFVKVTKRRVPARSTWTLTGGQGEGTSRMFKVSDYGGVGVARVEHFDDQTSLKTAYEVQASAINNNRRNAASYAVTVEVSDAAAQRVPFGRSVLVGDIVSVVVDQERFDVPVTELRFEISPSRKVVSPVLGTATPDALTALLRDVANLGARVNRDVA